MITAVATDSHGVVLNGKQQYYNFPSAEKRLVSNVV